MVCLPVASEVIEDVVTVWGLTNAEKKIPQQNRIIFFINKAFKKENFANQIYWLPGALNNGPDDNKSH